MLYTRKTNIVLYRSISLGINEQSMGVKLEHLISYSEGNKRQRIEHICTIYIQYIMLNI